MAKANAILLNSILWNLREVTKLAEKIKKHCGDVDCTSWRYPLTSCSELEIFKLLQNNRNLDNYTYILELTYDRLLYLFNLMIKYLESADSLEKFRPGKNVCRPKTLSLAAVLHMIWDRIQAQTENLTSAVPQEKSETDEPEKTLYEKEMNASKTSICTQSEVCSISFCSCCEMVQQFVTQLVLDMEKVVEKHDFCSAILSERKIMREYLVEMTSWSAMSRWLTAITKDFTTLTEKVEQVTTNSRKLRHRLDSGDRKMKIRIEQHEEETRKSEVKIRDYESKILDMKQKMEKLIEEKHHLNEEVQKKNSELASRGSDFEHKIAELKKNYENKLKEKKEKKLNREREKEELKKRLNTECKKSEKLESQNKKLEETIQKLEDDLLLSNSKNAEEKNGLLIRLKDAESKVESLKQEILAQNSVLEEKQKIIKDYSARIMDAFPELNGASKPTYKASGIPEIDMENQIEANKLRIELLKTENEKLSRTLDKIKSIKC